MPLFGCLDCSVLILDGKKGEAVNYLIMIAGVYLLIGFIIGAKRMSAGKRGSAVGPFVTLLLTIALWPVVVYVER